MFTLTNLVDPLRYLLPSFLAAFSMCSWALFLATLLIKPCPVTVPDLLNVSTLLGGTVNRAIHSELASLRRSECRSRGRAECQRQRNTTRESFRKVETVVFQVRIFLKYLD